VLRRTWRLSIWEWHQKVGTQGSAPCASSTIGTPRAQPAIGDRRLDRRYAHHVERPLDIHALQAGSRTLVGVHDFAAFGQPTQGDGALGPEALRHRRYRGVQGLCEKLYDACWRQDGPWFTFDVVGNAFLRGMVRCLVGTLLQVGAGFWPVERVAEVLESRNRALAAPPAPACGLCLMRVEY